MKTKEIESCKTWELFHFSYRIALKTTKALLIVQGSRAQQIFQRGSIMRMMERGEIIPYLCDHIFHSPIESILSLQEDMIGL